MPTSYTSLLGLALPVTGELSGTWGDEVNNYITQYLDASVAGTQTISGSQTAVTLSKTTNAALSQAGAGATGSSQYLIINCTGNPASLLTVTAPAASKPYIVINGTSTSQSVKIVGAGPTTGVTLVSGEKAIVAWDGSDFVKVASSAVGDVTAAGNNAFTGANTFYNATGQTFGTATAAQDGIIVKGRAGGTSTYRVSLAPGTLSASRTATLPDGGGNYTIGYQNIPAVGTKTSSYILTTADIGKYVQVSTGGSITIPDATFAEGDVVSIFNNTTGNITITCSITTAYIAGTDADKATVTLSTRGVATILFISSTVCVIAGNVS